MLCVKSRFRLSVRCGKLALALWAVLAGGALVICQMPQAAAAQVNFTVTDKIPDANPCKKDGAARHEALKKAVKAVLSSKVIEKINKNINGVVKGKGSRAAVHVDVELAPDWQTYQKIFSVASGDKLTDAGAQSDFGATAVISRNASKNGLKQIKTVFFCNKQLQDAFTRHRLPRVFVRALAHAEARAITFAGIAKSDLPKGYSTGDDDVTASGKKSGAGKRDDKFGQHVDALLKLVPGAHGKETAKASKPKAPAKPAKAAVARTKKKDESKTLAETQPLATGKSGTKKVDSAKAKAAEAGASAMTTIKKSPDQKVAVTAKASGKAAKLKAKVERRHHRRHAVKHRRRHHVSHRHHRRHAIRHKRRHRHYYQQDDCIFSFLWL